MCNKQIKDRFHLFYRGPAVVVVSCVEEKEPYRCHPHKLVGKDGMCKKGVCSMDINTPDMTATFQVNMDIFNLSIILKKFNQR